MNIALISTEETYPLRLKVLRPGLPPESAVFPQDKLEGTFHLGVVQDNQIVCIGTFQKENFPPLKSKRGYRLRGMATDPEFQGRGFAAGLLRFSHPVLMAEKCDLLWFNAREVAFGFYEKQNFEYHGGIFNIPGVGPHRVMYRWLK